MEIKQKFFKKRKNGRFLIAGMLFLAASVFFCLSQIHPKTAFAQGDPDVLVQEGRDYLAAHDIVNANQCFEGALASDPDHAEANFFYSVTRILALVYKSDYTNLLDRFGVAKEGRDIYDWTADFPRTFPDDSPTSGEVIAFLTNTVLPQVEGALGNLAAVSSSFKVILTSQEIDSDQDLEVDYGDILVYKSSLNLVRGAILLLGGYNLDVDIDDIVNRGENDPDIIHEKLIEDKTLLTIKDRTKILDAKAAILQGINYYLNASGFIRSEADDQTDDCITIDPKDLSGERKFRLILIQVRDSLEANDTTTEDFTVQLSQFLDLSQLFTNPVNLRDLFFGGGVQNILDTHLSPQIDRALNNLSKSNVTENFAQILTPEEYPVDKNVEIDFGDISSVRAGLNAAKATINMAATYNIDVDIWDIARKIYKHTLDVKRDIFDTYPDLLKLIDKTKALSARDSMVACIDDYSRASTFIRNEMDDQSDDLITISSRKLKDERRLRVFLAQLKDSLEGKISPTFTVELSQFLNLSRSFEDPVVLRDLLTGRGVQDFLTKQILPQVNQALNNLSGAGRDFNQILSPLDYPIDDPLEVDFGDIAAIRAGLNALKAGINVIAAYDVNVDLCDTLDKIDKSTFKFNDFLPAYPNFLNLIDGAGERLRMAKTALNDGINIYFEASEFIRDERDDQEDDLVTIAPRQLEDESEFRARLTEIQTAISGPTEIQVKEPFTLDLTQFFDEPINLRAFLPEFRDDNRIIIGTFPDPTFSGILPNFTQEDLTKTVDDYPPRTVLDPSGTLYYDGTNYYAPINFTYTLSATDNYSGIERIEYSVDGSPFIEYTSAFNLTSEGPHTISYKALDKAGNWEQTRSTTIIVDTTPPSAPVGLTGSQVNLQVRLSWTANSERDIWGYNIYRDGVKINTQLITWANYYDTIINGKAYTYNVTAVDRARNESSFSTSISITTLSSAPIITYPYSGSVFVDSTVVVRGNTESGATVEVFVNRASQGTTLASAGGWFSLSGVSLSEGENKITAIATTSYGVICPESSTLTVFLDPRPQPPSGLNAAPGDTVITLSWNPNPEADISGYRIYRDNRQLNINLLTSTEFTDTQLTNGRNYTYAVVAADRRGSESDKTSTLTIAPVAGPEWEVP